MKGLGPRAYNIVFHTHTVSGIVISLVLFIIFFAGAVSLYKQEIYQWEDPAARVPLVLDNIDYDKLLIRMDSLHEGVGHAHEIRVVMPTQPRPVYTFYIPIEDSTGFYYATFFHNPVTDQTTVLNKGEGPTTGETLYRLHFLDQVPWYIGRYIAGLVSVFFAFAIVTGVLIHWKNIVSRFYAFSFRKVAKQFWTNTHTVFAMIGLPFQLMYALTGAFYMLSLLILAPAVMVLFKGDEQQLITMVYPTEAFHGHDEDSPDRAHMPIAAGLSQIRKDYPAYTIAYLDIINPGKENAVLGAELVDEETFNGNGTVVLDLHTGEYKLEIKPGEKNYAQSILQGINNLHFGHFAGWLSRALYFILSIVTCFVIISGVLMWKEARNKPAYSDKQRHFHHRVTMIYLAVCFSLFPATAVLFITEQCISAGEGRIDLVNSIFFLSWLLLALLAYLLKTEKRMTTYCLGLGGALACLVPLMNGLCTSDWLWGSWKALPYVFMTDTAWLITGLFSLIVAFALAKNTGRTSSTAVLPGA